MPYFSQFTPFGHLRFSGAPSVGEQMYESLVTLEGGAFAQDQGTDTGAETYAKAMMLADGQQALERAGNQRDPMRAAELLPVREQDWRAAALPTQTLDQRRAAQAMREKRGAGGRASDISAALTTLLGSDFIAYRPTSITEKVVQAGGTTTAGVGIPYAVSPTTGLFPLPTTPTAVIQLQAPVVALNTLTNVAFTSLTPGFQFGNALIGQPIVIDAGSPQRREIVVVNQIIPNSTNTILRAAFTMTHEIGATGVIGYFPAWRSSKRHSLIVVSPAASLDPVRRNAIHQVMKRYARGVSTWSIVAGNAATRTTGPFVVGVTPINTAPLGALTF